MGEQGTRFSSCWRQNSATDDAMLHYTEPFIMTPSLYRRHTLYAEGIYSFCQFRLSIRLPVLPPVFPSPPSVCPSVILSVNPFYNQVLLRSF